MTTKLTDRFFTSRKAPLKARTIYTDSVVPGLTFRVHPRNGVARSSGQRRRKLGADGCATTLPERTAELPNVANTLVALRADPKLKDSFAFDQMLQAPLLMQPLDDSEDFTQRPLTDTDVTRCQEFLQHAGLRNISKEIMHQAADARAEERAFHPVRDYLHGLKWDGRARLNSWLTTYLGTKQTTAVQFCERRTN